MTYFSFIPRTKFFFGKGTKKVKEDKPYDPQFLYGTHKTPRARAIDSDFDANNNDLTGLERQIRQKGTVFSDNSS